MGLLLGCVAGRRRLGKIREPDEYPASDTKNGHSSALEAPQRCARNIARVDQCGGRDRKIVADGFRELLGVAFHLARNSYRVARTQHGD